MRKITAKELEAVARKLMDDSLAFPPGWDYWRLLAERINEFLAEA